MSTKNTKKTIPLKPKKKNTKKQKTSRSTLIPFLFILLFALLATSASYFLLFKNSSNENIKEPISITQIKEEKKTEVINFDEKLPKYQFEEITKEFNVDYETHPKVENKQEETKTSLQEKSVFKDAETIKKIEKVYEEKSKQIETKSKEIKETENVKKTENALTSSKPKLAIIIDDITTSYQIKKAKEVGYTLNLAFLPPTKIHPHSAKVAQDIPNHMIHLPLQASPNFTSQEKGVLKADDSYATIEKRIKELRAMYPKVIYTNNHTGSVFTQNDIAMDNLYKALKKYNFIFVDSRTSPNSVAKKYAQKYNMPFYARNTFIDNNKDKAYIKNQLLKAVNLAKKNGFAIAIGHPYKETFEVLKNSSEILNEIEPVFVHQL